MAPHRLEVDDHALQGRHQRPTHDRHHEEGGSQGGIQTIHMLQGDAIDRGEHQRHEETDAHQTVEPWHAHDEDGAYRAQCCPTAEDGEQYVGVDVFHQERRYEAATEEERHRHDVIHLGRRLVDAQVVGIVDDEGPHHDLRSHVKHLCHHALAIDRIVPQVAQRLTGRMGMSLRLLLLTLCLGHLGEGDHGQHDEHHDADGHVGVADHGQVVQADLRLLSLGESEEEDLTSLVATVGDQLWQYDERGDAHATERSHGIERLRHVKATGGRLAIAQRQDEGIGRGLQESQSEGQDIERQAEEGELLVGCRRDEEEGTYGVERQSQHDAPLIRILADEEGGRHGHRGIAAIEGKLYHRGLRCRQFHHRLEGCHHRVGDIVGKAPQCKERRDEDKGQEVLTRYQRFLLFHIS